MKKFLTGVLAVIVVFSCSACAGKDQPQNSVDSPTNTSSGSETANNDGTNSTLSSGDISLETLLSHPVADESMLSCIEDINGDVCLSRYEGDDPILVLPETYQGKTIITTEKWYSLGSRSIVKAVKFPDSMDEIGENSCGLNENLQIVVCGKNTRKIGEYAFLQCSALETVILNNGLETIEMGAFAMCENLKSVYIPESVTSIGIGAFTGYSDIVIYGKAGSYAETFAEQEGRQFKASDDDPSIKIFGNNDTSNDNDEISDVPSTNAELLETLLSHSAANENEFKYLDDGNGGVYINNYEGNNEILVIPDKLNGKTVTSIERPSFERSSSYDPINLENVQAIKFPDSITRIGYSACNHAENLKAIVLGNNTKTIGSYAFGNCEQLETVKLNEGLETISGQAFFKCEKLRDIYIPESVTSIDSSTFENCNRYFTIYGKSGSYAETYAKDNNIPFKSTGEVSGDKYTKPDSSISLENVLAHPVTDVSRFEIANDENGGFCFNDYDESDTIVVLPDEYLGKDITSLYKICFSESSNIQAIKISNPITTINEMAFSDNENLQIVILGENTKTIESLAFSRCSNLKIVILNDGLETIVGGAFGECTSLETIELNNGLKTIEDHAFAGCENLKNITIPDSVTELGNSAFRNCISLETVELGNGLEEISYYTFENCENLKSIYIPESVTYIWSEAFDGCPDNFVIYGKAGSYAETYANEHNIRFEVK